MSPRLGLVVGCLLAALAVLLGAYHAHGLENKLYSIGFFADEVARRMETRWEPAVRYMMYHAIAMILVGLVGERNTWFGRAAGELFLLGIVLFSGLLLVMTFTGDSWNWLGRIVPIGGVSFIIGWASLAAAGMAEPFVEDEANVENAPKSVAKD